MSKTKRHVERQVKNKAFFLHIVTRKNDRLANFVIRNIKQVIERRVRPNLSSRFNFNRYYLPSRSLDNKINLSNAFRLVVPRCYFLRDELLSDNIFVYASQNAEAPNLARFGASEDAGGRNAIAGKRYRWLSL